MSRISNAFATDLQYFTWSAQKECFALRNLCNSSSLFCLHFSIQYLNSCFHVKYDFRFPCQTGTESFSNELVLSILFKISVSVIFVIADVIASISSNTTFDIQGNFSTIQAVCLYLRTNFPLFSKIVSASSQLLGLLSSILLTITSCCCFKSQNFFSNKFAYTLCSI